MTEERVIVVSGATGQQGGAVARHLLAEGWPVRALSRDPSGDKAQALARSGAEVVAADLDDPSTLEGALSGVHGVFSIQTPWTRGIEGEIEQGVALAQAAKAAGTAHFVYSSVGGAHRDTGVPHFDSKWRIEERIAELGLRATILRPAFFMENFFMPDTRTGVEAGTLSLGMAPEKPLQMIAVDDIGALTALAFARGEEFVGRAIDISGDELTGPQMAEAFAKVMRRPVAYDQTPIEQIRAFSDDFAKMFEWFNARGYEADIGALRKLHPGLKSFETWLSEAGWAQSPAEAGAP